MESTNNEFAEQFQSELERIKHLPIEEQVAAYSALRELLESTLNQIDGQ